MTKPNEVTHTRRRPYKLTDGAIVPSVTTVLGRFKESGALLHWAHAQGLAGLDYRATRDKAATTGTLAHTMAESWFRGHPQKLNLMVDADIRAKAYTSFHAFLTWARGQKMRPAVIDGVTQVEIRMVSERYRYGGMMDAVQMGDSDDLSLWDMKTSGGVYIDYLMQLAAYGALWDETHPDRPITGGYHLVRFDKISTGFVHHYWSALECVNSDGEVISCLDQFLRLLDCYVAEKTLKKLLK